MNNPPSFYFYRMCKMSEKEELKALRKENKALQKEIQNKTAELRVLTNKRRALNKREWSLMGEMGEFRDGEE